MQQDLPTPTVADWSCQDGKWNIVVHQLPENMVRPQVLLRVAVSREMTSLHMIFEMTMPVESAPGGKAQSGSQASRAETQSGSQASRAEDPGGLECAEWSKHTKFRLFPAQTDGGKSHSAAPIFIDFPFHSAPGAVSRGISTGSWVFHPKASFCDSTACEVNGFKGHDEGEEAEEPEAVWSSWEMNCLTHLTLDDGTTGTTVIFWFFLEWEFKTLTLSSRFTPNTSLTLWRSCGLTSVKISVKHPSCTVFATYIGRHPFARCSMILHYVPFPKCLSRKCSIQPV